MPMSQDSTIDPITIAVLSARLTAIVEEMGEALLRTAYSQILNSSRDFSVALCDGQSRLVAQADHLPVHVGAMPFAAKAVADQFASEIRPGDIFLVNDPWHGGSHLPDLTVVVPVFGDNDENIHFFAVVRAHQSDIGGGTHGGYNPEATEIWQEGLRIPPIRLGEGGVVRPDLLAMLASNTRLPREFRGDMQASVGAALLAERRLHELFGRIGVATVMKGVDEILDLAEARARAIVAEWADGTWKGQAVLDDDGNGAEDVTIRATVTKQGSSITVDLSDSDPQTLGFVNSSYANMRSCVVMALAFLLDPDIPKNDGAFRLLSVIAKEGTVVNAREGAAVTLCTSHCANEIVDAIMQALANACPDRVVGGYGRRFRIALAGTDPRRPSQTEPHGRRFVWHLFHARPGGGAFAGGDGWPLTGGWSSIGGTKFGSIEMAEKRFPLLFLRHEFRPNSGGDGAFRGGLGGVAEIRVESDREALCNTAGDGVRYGAVGVAGGLDGKPHDYVLKRMDGTQRHLRTKENGVVVQPGDVLLLKGGGGGGLGSPEDREQALRDYDMQEGYCL